MGSVTDGEVEECVDPGGNGAILNVGEGGGPDPPREGGNGQLASDSGGGYTFKMLESLRDGLTQHEDSLMHRVRIFCVKCALICHIPDSCDREVYLTVPICFRRINHMAVENHLHSSSGVRELCRAQVVLMKKKNQRQQISCKCRFNSATVCFIARNIRILYCMARG